LKRKARIEILGLEEAREAEVSGTRAAFGGASKIVPKNTHKIEK